MSPRLYWCRGIAKIRQIGGSAIPYRTIPFFLTGCCARRPATSGRFLFMLFTPILLLLCMILLAISSLREVFSDDDSDKIFPSAELQTDPG